MNFHLSVFQKMTVPSRSIFTALIVVLLWLPIPLGSATGWGWLTLTLLLWTITIIYWWQHQAAASVIIRRNRFLIWGWSIISGAQLLQLVPLPQFFISWVRPERLYNIALENTQWLPLSMSSVDTQLALLRSLSFFSLFLLTLLMIRSAGRIKLLLYVFVGAGVFQALYGSFSRGAGRTKSLILDLPLTDGASGTFITNSQYAHFLTLSLGAALGLLVLKVNVATTANLRTKLRRLVKYFFSRKAALRISVLFLVFGILMAESPIGIVAACVATTGCAIYGFAVFKPRPTHYLYFLGVLFLVNIAIGVGAIMIKTADPAKRVISVAPSLNANLLKPNSSPAVLRYGVLGAGAGTAEDATSSLQMIASSTRVAAPQNDYGQFLVELGVPLSLLFLALIVWCFGNAIIAMANRRHVVFRGAAFACVTGLSATLVQMAASTPLQSPANAAYVTVLLALSLTCLQCRKYQRA